MTGQRRIQGMTLIELTLGLASLSVLGLAISSLMVAAGAAWDAKDECVEQNHSLRAAAARIGEWVRQSRRVVSVAADDRYADVVLWTSDDSDPGNVNLNELKVITFDEQLRTVTLYQADPTATHLMNPLIVGSDSFGPTFRARNDVDAYPLAADVSGFAATAANGARTGPSFQYLHVEMALATPDQPTRQTAMVAAAVRAPDVTVDFLGEADEADGGGDGGGGLLSGLSIGLGTGVLGIDVEAAVNVGNDAPLASVFVGSEGD